VRLTELRRGDVDLEAASCVSSAASLVSDGEFIVADPKSHAGRRTVAIPPHLIPALKQHLRKHFGDAPGVLCFLPVVAATCGQTSHSVP